MTLKQYVCQAIRTECLGKAPTEPNDRLLWRLNHCALGLVTELAELDQSKDKTNDIEELGDLCWYLAIGIDALELPFTKLSDSYKCRTVASQIVADIVDEVKRSTYYEMPVRCWELFGLFGELFAWISLRLSMTAPGVGLVTVWERNIAKLRVRYPDKFTNEHAAVRDLEAERAALEK